MHKMSFLPVLAKLNFQSHDNINIINHTNMLILCSGNIFLSMLKTVHCFLWKLWYSFRILWWI